MKTGKRNDRFYEILGADSLLTAPLILTATVDINHSRATENLEQAALIATKKGDLSTLSNVYHNLSFEYFEVENLDSAAVYVQKSYAVSEQINSAKTWAYHYWLEANLAFRLQDYVEAEISFNKSLAHVSDSSKAVGLSCFSALVQLNIKKKQFQKVGSNRKLSRELPHTFVRSYRKPFFSPIYQRILGSAGL